MLASMMMQAEADDLARLTDLLEAEGWRVSSDFRVEGDRVIPTTPAAQGCDFLVNAEWCIAVTPAAKAELAARRRAWEDANADAPSAYYH